jgi:hypothetical protein
VDEEGQPGVAQPGESGHQGIGGQTDPSPVAAGSMPGSADQDTSARADANAGAHADLLASLRVARANIDRNSTGPLLYGPPRGVVPPNMSRPHMTMNSALTADTIEAAQVRVAIAEGAGHGHPMFSPAPSRPAVPAPRVSADRTEDERYPGDTGRWMPDSPLADEVWADLERRAGRSSRGAAVDRPAAPERPAPVDDTVDHGPALSGSVYPGVVRDGTPSADPHTSPPNAEPLGGSVPSAAPVGGSVPSAERPTTEPWQPGGFPSVTWSTDSRTPRVSGQAQVSDVPRDPSTGGITASGEFVPPTSSPNGPDHSGGVASRSAAAPDGAAPPVVRPEHAPAGHAPAGHAPAGQAPAEQAPAGQAPPEQSASGRPHPERATSSGGPGEQTESGRAPSPWARADQAVPDKAPHAVVAPNAAPPASTPHHASPHNDAAHGSVPHGSVPHGSVPHGVVRPSSAAPDVSAHNGITPSNAPSHIAAPSSDAPHNAAAHATPPGDAIGHNAPPHKVAPHAGPPYNATSPDAIGDWHETEQTNFVRNVGGQWGRPGTPRVVTPVLPHRIPAPPDVPDVPDDEFFDDYADNFFTSDAAEEDAEARPALDGPELTRIASGLRQPVPEPPPPPEELDVSAVLAAVRQVAGVREAQLRPNPGGVHTLRLDLADGADAGWVSRQVARLLKERMGLAAEPRRPRPPRPAGTPTDGAVAAHPQASARTPVSRATTSTAEQAPGGGERPGAGQLVERSEAIPGTATQAGRSSDGVAEATDSNAATARAGDARTGAATSTESAAQSTPIEAPSAGRGFLGRLGGGRSFAGPSITGLPATGPSDAGATTTPAVTSPTVGPPAARPAPDHPMAGRSAVSYPAAGYPVVPPNASTMDKTGAAPASGSSGQPSTVRSQAAQSAPAQYAPAQSVPAQSTPARLASSDYLPPQPTDQRAPGPVGETDSARHQTTSNQPDTDQAAAPQNGAATSARPISLAGFAMPNAATPNAPAARAGVTDHPVSSAPQTFSPNVTSMAGATARDVSNQPLKANEPRHKTPRVVLEQVHVSTVGTEATVEVRLRSGGVPSIGIAVGPAVDGYLLRLAAQATASAIDSLIARRFAGAPPIRCFIDHAGVVPFGECVVGVVVVLVSGDGWIDQLVGSALVSGDPRHAMARATLDAVNRRLERILGHLVDG